MGFVKNCLQNDVRRLRSVERWWVYRLMRWEYYQLAPIRVKMFEHRFIDKRRSSEEGQGQWKWVFHIKEMQPKSYNRFWSFTRHKNVEQPVRNVDG